MNQTGSTNPRHESELRARIAAGSRDVADYLEHATFLRSASHFEEAVGIYQHGLRCDLPNADKARLAWELGDLFDKVMDRSAEAMTLASPRRRSQSSTGISRPRCATPCMPVAPQRRAAQERG